VLQLVVFLALLFSVVIAVFAVQNTTAVDVSFLMFRAQGVAVSVLVLISAALGAAAMLLLGIAREVQVRWRTRTLNQRLKAAEAKVKDAEKMPAIEPAPPEAPTFATSSEATPPRL
jgi:putative membrane protein